MKLKIERTKKEPKPKKQKKPHTVKVGTHKKLTIALWVLLIGSISFGVYKNFTAIDMHTVHEKEVIEKQIVDTNKVESYVESFASEYFSWQQSQESIDKRNERLKHYLTEDLQLLNTDMVRVDIPTSSAVRKVQIWNVEEVNDTDFKVLFSVEHQLTEGETKKNVLSTYTVVVHMDKAGDMVIVENPTMNSKPEKSNFKPKQVESDGTVDAMMSEEINGFLETFFKLYPKATDKELAYYVSNNALPTINKDYVFVELVNPVYAMKDNKVTVIVTVKYLDQETKITQFSQYELVLEKRVNWLVIDSN
ncbi:conjugal transfer protein [Candidatus Enterococcus leclercqii]|uniref:conjugal transfer protein n=1 Tax=Candidatus Enterococcus leclercqii TaxID=1857218 RepID=UPI00137B7ADE|nr:conjugal transfer protein [Enterococcus sp. CU9D]KAF1290195.1 conjugal transfer protein [Enterococcus sp. CU9D]